MQARYIATLSSKAQRLLDNLQQATGPELSQMLSKFDRLIDRVQTIAEDVEVREAMANLGRTTDNLQRATSGLPATMERLDRAIVDIERLLGSEGDSLRVILHDLSDMIRNLKEFSDTAKRYPAAVLFGKSPPPANPDGASQDGGG